MSDIEPEVTIECEVAFSGKLIDVRKDKVRLPNGRTTVREIVVHPESVAILPVLEDGRIVLVRQYRKSAERILLETPAGGIDEGESPEEAAVREMKEETGYEVGSLQHLYSFFTSPGFVTEYMHLYRATDLKPGDATEENDQIEIVCLSLDDALDHARRGEVGDAKSVLALLSEETYRSRK
ncbi:MAG: NUDIX hydrolase [Chloroflexota bacterium]